MSTEAFQTRPTSSARAAAFERLDTGLVSDALERLGRTGAVTGLRSLSGRSLRVAGRAVTVALGPAGARRPAVHLGAPAIEQASPGDVVVVANDGRVDVAAWGGLLCFAAQARGVRAVVVDGLCRDVDDLTTLAVEVFALGCSPLSARGRVVEYSTGEPVHIGGVRVDTRDWVVGDASGVVVVPAGLADRVLEAAQRLAGRERRMRRALAAGRRVTEVLGAAYEDLLEPSDSDAEES